MTASLGETPGAAASPGSLGRSATRTAVGAMWRSRAVRFSTIFLGLVTALAVLGPYFLPHSPTEIEMIRQVGGETLLPPFAPSSQNWFGTDQLGRDIFTRTLYGVQISLVIGVTVRGISIVIGVLLGLIAGYFRGFASALVMRATDVMLTFPPLLVAMALTAILGPSLLTVGVAIVAVGWPDVTRLVLGQTLVTRETDYVEAARVCGASHARILGRHVLPNISGPIIVAFSMGIPGAIMYEAGLSFFGFGIQPPTPSLGSIISDGRGYMLVAPWYSLFPGMTLAAMVLAFNFLGEGLIDALNPRDENGR